MREHAYLSVLIDSADRAALEKLLAFAREKLGDRLVSYSITVDFSLLELADTDVDVFQGNSAPVTMVVDWGGGNDA